MVSQSSSPPSSSSHSLSLPKQLSRKVLLLLVVVLVFLQYLNLLQSRDGPRHRLGKASLFMLHWTQTGSDPEETLRKPLLTPLDQYLRDRVAQVRSAAFVSHGDQNVDNSTLLSFSYDDLNLFPDIVAPSAPMVVEESSASGLLLCPLIPPGLHGPVKVLLPDDGAIPPTWEALEALHPDLEPGGRRKPANCTARHRVALIVPYRDREEHLRIFLANIHPFLAKQQIDYQIYVVEQSNPGPFNRAMLMNVGAAEALKLRPDTQCFIFHDVDLLPEDDRNLYTCPSQPRHMSVAVNSFLYHLPYDDIFGGVSAMTVAHFRDVNGFSNLFWGWGGEDDDMSNRLRHKRLYISRYPANIARYKMLKHDKDKANPDRFKYLYSGAKRMSKDGYKSLRYRREQIQFKKLYTWIYVNLPHLKI